MKLEDLMQVNEPVTEGDGVFKAVIKLKWGH